VVDPDGRVRLLHDDLVVDGEINPPKLRELLIALPGGQAGISYLERNPAAAPNAVGEVIRVTAEASWKPSTIHTVGTHWRGWARAAGLRLEKVPRKKKDSGERA
jgi:hypothetical protein